MSASFDLEGYDPIADLDNDGGRSSNFVHLRIQQRNGKKTLTTIQGLPSDLDLRKILKVLKKRFCCNGTIVEDADSGSVIQLSGDQRKNAADFLIEEEICYRQQVKVHGF
eukprot:TRINITY_DN1616_c0_g2_i1.p1 TRINITY_DN1616_c0_g2~~TRINITY_DN1616_c0_g2_i1.p1  ORF type:complete len:110 (-),score=37.83 TRINITY_DN1616_c0_g2_i1:219-548(-)